MKSLKTFTSGVVAAALVGAIGLAYAQTQTPSQSTDSSTPMSNQSSTGTAANQSSTGSMANQSSTGTMGSSSNGSLTQAERPMQSDRN